MIAYSAQVEPPGARYEVLEDFLKNFTGIIFYLKYIVVNAR